MNMRRHIRSLVAAALVGGMTLSPGAQAAEPTGEMAPAWDAATVTAASQATSVEGPIDRRDRTAVARAYSWWLVPAVETPVGWSGSVDRCVAGTESAASRAATISAVNYYRAMTGLPPVVEYEPWSSKALDKALMIRAASDSSHWPDEDWPCYSADGREAASSSNLFFGQRGAASIPGYILDPGLSNTAVGHRRWILYPPSTRMGTGSTDRSNTLWVIDRELSGSPARPDGVDWVAWPPSGYVPWEVALVEDHGRQLFRWSLSSNTMPAADYAAASVAATLTTAAGVEPLEVDLEPNDSRGYGDQTLVWNARRRGGASFPVTGNAEVTITVRGIINDGRPVEPYVYTVNAFRAAFTDVAGTTHRTPIEALDAAGFAGGYPDGTFRPSVNVTRGQMASLLANTLDLPAADGTTFVDTAGTTHAAAIEAVAASGITGGFSDGSFRPSEPVTRAQFAAFLDRALDLPATSGTTFVDTADTTHATSIETVAAAGITSGYADGTYRPAEAVTRGQMATFLVTALGL